MCRWALAEDFGKVVNTGITDIHCDSNSSAEVAKMLHNADCDAYEARIAELEAKVDWAQQIVKAQEQTSNGVACAEERALGNGGCGACSWCCSQWREKAESARNELTRVKAESLRVVKSDAVCSKCKGEGRYFEPTYNNSETNWKQCDVCSGEGKSFRLERWEMEDGN